MLGCLFWDELQAIDDFLQVMNEHDTRDEMALGLMAAGVSVAGGAVVFRPLSMLSLVRLQRLGCGVYDLVMLGRPLARDDCRAFLEYAWVHAAPEGDVEAALAGGGEAARAAVDSWGAGQSPALLMRAALEVRQEVERCVAMMAEVMPERGGRVSKNAQGRRC